MSKGEYVDAESNTTQICPGVSIERRCRKRKFTVGGHRPLAVYTSPLSCFRHSPLEPHYTLQHGNWYVSSRPQIPFSGLSQPAKPLLDGVEAIPPPRFDLSFNPSSHD